MQLPRVLSDTEPLAPLVRIMEQPNRAEKKVEQQPQTHLEYRQTSCDISFSDSKFTPDLRCAGLKS